MCTKFSYQLMKAAPRYSALHRSGVLRNTVRCTCSDANVLEDRDVETSRNVISESFTRFSSERLVGVARW